MRTLIHLSDLHFGRVDAQLLAPLIDRIATIQPDLVVVSGDLTQRARSDQFKAARDFLGALPRPQIVVPGNHDIPMHNVFDRFVRPLQKYRRYISDDLEPAYIDGEIAVLGVNTARSATIKGGRINRDQLGRLRARMTSLPGGAIKVVVTHHPFDLPSHHQNGDLVGRAPAAMQLFAECGVDLLLAGHFHASHAGHTALRYRIGNYAAVAAQAGTATSTRGRGEANAFNLVRLDPSHIMVERYEWDAGSRTFTSSHADAFTRTVGGWSRSIPGERAR